MSDDRSDQLAIVRSLKAQNGRLEAENSSLKGGGGDGTSGGMEPRIAILEADMKHVKEGLSNLSAVPADLATLKERTSHFPTKAEMQSEIAIQLDRLGTRVQRQVAITGTLITIVIGGITLAAKFL